MSEFCCVWFFFTFLCSSRQLKQCLCYAVAACAHNCALFNEGTGECPCTQTNTTCRDSMHPAKASGEGQDHMMVLASKNMKNTKYEHCTSFR